MLMGPPALQGAQVPLESPARHRPPRSLGGKWEQNHESNSRGRSEDKHVEKHSGAAFKFLVPSSYQQAGDKHEHTHVSTQRKQQLVAATPPFQMESRDVRLLSVQPFSGLIYKQSNTSVLFTKNDYQLAISS